MHGLARTRTSGTPVLTMSESKYSDSNVAHSYYLSSHHIDIHCWMMQDRAVPTRVVASAAAGIATSEPYNCVPQTEDTITLLVDWQSLSSSKHRGTAVYTASWTAPLKSGVHTSQHFYYMGEKVRSDLRPLPSYCRDARNPGCGFRGGLRRSHTTSAAIRCRSTADNSRFLRAKSTSTKLTAVTTSSMMRPARRGTTHSSA